MSFVHLDVHSNYSMLDGASPVEELVKKAASLDMEALALTDTDGLYGIIPFLSACREVGIRALPGVELSCPREGQRVILLPRDRDGYREICRLVTARHLDRDFILREACLACSDKVFLLSDSVPLLQALVGRKNVYAALPGAREARQKRYSLAALAERLRLGTVATADVHFAEPSGYEVHRLLRAMATRTTLGALPGGATVSRDCYLKGEEEMRRIFRDLPESLEAAAEIAWSCRVDFELGLPRPPRFDPPEGETPYSYLATLAFAGLKRRLGAFDREALDLLTRELDVIERLGMASYFLVCWDIVRFARSRGMPSLGRGSAANSMVSYCLGITHVNPMEHNLFFERFLNLERATPPDFDLDFGTDDREEVLRYIFERYGRDHTAMVSTVNTFRARSAFRETAKALGVPEKEVDRFAKMIPHFTGAGEVEEVLAANPETRELPAGEEPFASILSLARRIAGFPRHLSTHPCGLVIAPEPVSDLVPLEVGEKGLPITQWSMYPIEDVGLIKIDIIGQKGLAVIEETVAAVERNYGASVDTEAIDYLADRKTKALMREGKTEGCFYIESPVMQQLLRQARCDDFEALTALSSIIRPGVSNYGGKRLYLKRYLGEEPVTYPHPLLEPVLKDSLGCLVYQEQVIQTAVRLAGMSLAEADGLRRCMSKKRDWEKMGNYRERFFRGAREKGIPEGVIDEVFTQIESFAGYAFCKAHSASFALESFQSLYWKAHYPAEFMAAVLSNRGGYYSPLEYLEEARRMGLVILPPSVNNSAVHFTGKGRELRVGLMQVKGLRRETAERIVAERERVGSYSTLEEFLARVNPNRREAEALAKCGALDSLGGSRPEILWQVSLGLGRGSGHGALLCRAELLRRLPLLDDLSFEEKLAWELECLDLCVSAHPFALFRKVVDRAKRLRPVVDSVDVADHEGERVYCLGWLVTVKRVRTEREGKPMAFVSFCDERGRIEAALFPEAYDRCARELFRGPGPFLIMGKVEQEEGVPNVLVEKLALLRPASAAGAGPTAMLGGP